MASIITTGIILLLGICLIAADNLHILPGVLDVTFHGDPGNTTAADGQFPWQVSLQRASSNRHICSGAIIDEHWILTVAHCVEDLKSAKEIKAVIGTNKLANDGIGHRLRAIYINPMFVQTMARQHDIAMLHTMAKIEFNEKVRPAHLPDGPAVVNEFVQVSGWGQTMFPLNPPTSDTEIMAKDLQFDSTLVIPNYECEDRLSAIHMKNSVHDYNVCTLSENITGTCHTDAGSPLVNEHSELVGLAAWGKSCALGYPDVFTGVFDHLKWIHHLIAHMTPAPTEHMHATITPTHISHE